MGKVYTEIKFYQLDYSRIEVVSASTIKDFNAYRMVNDFGKERGKFLIDNANKNHQIFQKENGDFVEFIIL